MKKKLRYTIAELFTLRNDGVNWDKWYRIYDNEGRMISLYKKKKLSTSDIWNDVVDVSTHKFVTEVHYLCIVEKILDELNKGIDNSNNVYLNEKDYIKKNKLSVNL